MTRELPTGTVTFLFTDVEGSTRLLQELGDRYGAVRDAHAAILRRAMRDGGGVEVSTEGDSFFAAFASPVGAVRSAVAAQRSTLQPTTTNERPLSGAAYRAAVAGPDPAGVPSVNREARLLGARRGLMQPWAGYARGAERTARLVQDPNPCPAFAT